MSIVRSVFRSIFEPVFRKVTEPSSGSVSALPNLLLKSEKFGDSPWTGSATVTANVSNDPDGNATVDRLTDTGAGHQSRSQTIVISGSKEYTFSFLLVKDVVTNRFPEIAMDFTGGVAKTHRQFLNTSTGATLARSGFNNGTISVTSYDSTFWLVQMTTTANSDNTSVSVGIFPATSNTTIGQIESTATGSLDVAWGQLNTGPTRSAYSRND